jgi:hypothetical protein
MNEASLNTNQRHDANGVVGRILATRSTFVCLVDRLLRRR